ncbi:putative ripening-related protein 4 [Zingiber officinale]|uniref:Ripening-related protein 1 n=1 Tax=Zingiber officinale TaxID=94328 RepID=A0A8J5ETK0_ZINOF|nr:putative ripening-related protein 4 [Zingiber officinale]KAG6474998.1 hypothetical protein ZIOFF_064215 [Zingiber officinale]
MGSSISLCLLIVLAILALAIEPASAQDTPRKLHGACLPSGRLRGKAGKCNREHDSECCVPGKSYRRFKCSPPVVAGGTRAHLTVNSFAKGGDGGGPSECDGKFHPDHEKVVALSTGWYAGGSRCGKKIVVRANGRSVKAKVVDECDSMNGCDQEHDFQPPCPNNIVDASPAVWKALGIPDSVGYTAITWSDA